MENKNLETVSEKKYFNYKNTQKILLIMGSLYILLALFFVLSLDYDFMRSDVLSYWKESINWRVPFNEHPPLYALVIALLRAVTFNIIPPTILMMSVNLVTFLCSIYLVIEIAKEMDVTATAGWFMAVVFGLWPFVGLTYTVVPLADMPSIALTLAGILMLQKNKNIMGAIFFGTAIITHKGVWPIIALVTIALLIRQRNLITKRGILTIVILLIPLAILWISGAIYHDSINWFMERSMEVNTTLDGGFKIFNGIIGTFQEGGIKGLVKGSIVLFMTLLALLLLLISLRNRNNWYELSVAISLSVLMLFIFSSAGTIWGPVRFSRFLSIPLFLISNSFLKEKHLSSKTNILSSLLISLLIISQFVYAWYIAKVFFA